MVFCSELIIEHDAKCCDASYLANAQAWRGISYCLVSCITTSEYDFFDFKQFSFKLLVFAQSCTCLSSLALVSELTAGTIMYVSSANLTSVLPTCIGSPTLKRQPYEGRLPLTSWWRKSSNVTVGQSSLIYLAHHCYD